MKRMLTATITAVLLAQMAHAAGPPKMKMTTEIPEGLSIPDKVETSIGTLNFRDGVPDEATAKLIYDNLDLVRATTAYLDGLRIASMHAMLKGTAAVGAKPGEIVIHQEPMDSKSLWLTPNTTVLYIHSHVDLSDGPVVIDAPPGLLGLLDDAAFEYVADIGKAGPDKGKGGKFLILPPEFEGDGPDGYFTFRSKAYDHWLLLRIAPNAHGDAAKTVAEVKKSLNVYPLSEAANPPQETFHEVAGVPHNTIHQTGFGFWEEVDAAIQKNPAGAFSPEILGSFAAVGIRKGHPFEPDARMKAILTDAANIGHATARTIASRPRRDEFYFYPGESYWGTPAVGGSYLFEDENGARNLEAQTMMFFYATGVTPAMFAAPVGAGSQYAMLYLDVNGEPLDGAKTYKVTLPPNVPAKDFWSFVVYDNQTRSMLQTDQRYPSVSSAKGKVRQNEDGSFDVYFGPQAPQGWEDNWVQTIPGKGWNMLFRLYGPLEPWFDKTWRPGDAVPLN